MNNNAPIETDAEVETALSALHYRRASIGEGPLDFWLRDECSAVAELAAYKARVAAALAELHAQIEGLDYVPAPFASEQHAAKMLREDAVKCVRAAVETLGLEAK